MEILLQKDLPLHPHVLKTLFDAAVAQENEWDSNFPEFVEAYGRLMIWQLSPDTLEGEFPPDSLIARLPIARNTFRLNTTLQPYVRNAWQKAVDELDLLRSRIVFHLRDGSLQGRFNVAVHKLHDTVRYVREMCESMLNNVAAEPSTIPKQNKPLLQSSLQSLRTRFEKLVDPRNPITCILVESTRHPHGWPEFAEPVGKRACLWRNVPGNYITLYGNEDPNGFKVVADDAAELLGDLPEAIKSRYWEQLSDGRWVSPFGQGDGSWMAAIVELSTQCPEGSTLNAQRWAWHGCTSFPAAYVGDCKRRGDKGSEHINDPPDETYVKIEDIVSASVAAIDLFLHWNDSPPARRPGKGIRLLRDAFNDVLFFSSHRDGCMWEHVDKASKMLRQAHAEVPRIVTAERAQLWESALSGMRNLAIDEPLSEERRENLNVIEKAMECVRVETMFPKECTIEAGALVPAIDKETRPSIPEHDDSVLGQTSEKTDTSKKRKNRRELNQDALVCIRRYKKYKREKDPQSMQFVVDEYVLEHKGKSASGLYRRLTDNRDHWE